VKDFTKSQLILGIVGSGAMGRGIAQIAAVAGIKVILHDTDPTASESAKEFIRSMLSRSVANGRINNRDADEACDRITCAHGLFEFADADLVIEAILENLEIKQTLFGDLEQIVSPQCILATNTSSLSVTAIARNCNKPERVAGFHFFNPVPLMKLVEVISGFHTEKKVIQSLSAFADRVGHSPVIVADSPGFLVNHAGRGLNTEGLRLLDEQVTNPATVDAIMRDTVGFRMGPFELMDLTGLDVTYPVTEEIYQGFYQEPRLRPTADLRQRFSAGVWGRKTDAGFYKYRDGQRLNLDNASQPNISERGNFWVSTALPDLADKIHTYLSANGAKLDTGSRPDTKSIAIVTPLGLDATSTCVEQHLNPATTIAVDALFCCDQHITLMTNPKTTQLTRDLAQIEFARGGRKVSVVRDSAGMVAPRIIATIVNIACDIAQKGIATPRDIDTAVTLGLGYPMGPLTLGDELGARTVITILEGLLTVYGDTRYRPSPWLRRRAQLNISLLCEES